MNVSSIDSINYIQTETPDNSSKVRSDENSFSSCLACTKSLEDIFQNAAATYDVPVKLLKAVAKAESGFNPNAVSYCGAQGIMQLMPSTAAYLGVEDAFDPEQNIMGGAKYLSNLLKTYQGDVTLTLAAYNAGSGNVKKYGGVPPFKETQNYIKKISEYMNQNFSLDHVMCATKPSSQTAFAPSFKANTNNTQTEAADRNNSSTGFLRNISSRQSDIWDLNFDYEDYMRFLEFYTKLSLFDEEEEQNTDYEIAKERLSSVSIRTF